jgi:hypothetical protein
MRRSGSGGAIVTADLPSTSACRRDGHAAGTDSNQRGTPMSPMTSEDWENRLAAKRPEGPAYNAEAVVREALRLLTARGAPKEWLLIGREYVVRALAYDPSTGELLVAVPSLDGGPSMVVRGPEALPTLARQLIEYFRIYQMGAPAEWVENVLQGSLGLDPALARSYTLGHLWRTADGKVAYRPFTSGAQPDRQVPARFGGQELLDQAVSEIGAVMSADIRKANA